MQTRGVFFVHSSPSVLRPHIEWATAGVLGMPVRLDWYPQPVEPGTFRTELSWYGPVGVHDGHGRRRSRAHPWGRAGPGRRMALTDTEC